MKHFLVVGGSKGIGRQISEQLSQRHTVYCMSRTAPGIPNVVHIPVDVTQDEIDVSALPEELDGIAYCPGSINLKPFRSLKEADFISDYTINVIGATKVLKAVERRLKKGENPGSVVLFSTVAATQGMPFHASIAAAKGAVEGLTRSLAAEWAPNIRVNCVAPSLTDTPLAASLLSNDEKKENAGKRHPLRRIGNPADIANAAVYLLSQDSGWVTGQVIAVDGGMSRVRV